MNKTNLIIETILGVAVVALFVLHFTSKPTCDHPVVAADGSVAAELPIAYINLDSLLENYQFAIEANDQIMSKQEDARLKLNTRARNLQNKAADFQRKLDNNAFLSRERAEQEAMKIQKEQQELQELEANLSQDIAMELQDINLQLADSLTNYLKEYNADGRFQMILSNTGKDNILMAADALDITNDVIEGLNARYSK